MILVRCVCMTKVTVCVPIFEASKFLGETLVGIKRQNFTDFRVMMSVDRGRDNSAAICRDYLIDSRFFLVEQPNRLGWVKNCNWLIRHVETEFFCIVPHDDIIHPDYLGLLLELLNSRPEAVNVFCDLQGFGESSPFVVQNEVRGPRFRRVLDVFLNHFSSVSFRGLTRIGTSGDLPLLPDALEGHWGADTAWLMVLALRGELCRLPATLYKKRYHSNSVHASWWRSDVKSSLVRLTALMCRLALVVTKNETERQLVTLAAVMRLCGIGDAGFPLDPLDRAMILMAFARDIDADDLRIDKNSLLRTIEAGPLNSAMFCRQGLRSLASKRYVRAQHQFRKALEADPLSTVAQRELSKVEKVIFETAQTVS